jgi:hypothetical protein
MSALLKVLGCFMAFAGFILFVSWMGRPKDSVASLPPGTTVTTPGSNGYRLADNPGTTTHKLTAGDSLRFGLIYAAGGALMTDSQHFFSPDHNDGVSAVRGLGERPANASNGAVFLAPGGQNGAAAATVSLGTEAPPTRGFDRFIDVSVPAPTGRLLLAPNGDTFVTDAIVMPKGTYRARIRVRGPENGEDLRIDFWPARQG